VRLPWLLKGYDFDVALVFTTPITAALPAILMRRVKHCHLALWVQDLWPDVVISTGHIRNPLLLGVLRFLVRFVYKSADTVLVQSDGFLRSIAKIVPKHKLFLVPNFATSIDAKEISSLPPEIEKVFKGRFSVVFAGNLGRAQALSTIVETARALQSHSEIVIVLVGAGSQLDSVRRQVADANLTNVVLTGGLDSRMMPELFGHADCLLVTLGRDPALSATVPSKVQAYLKAGRPIVGAISGSAADLIAAAGAGLTVEAEDSSGLAKRILELHNMPIGRREEMGRAGRAYYEQHFDAGAVVNRLLEILEHRSRHA